MSRRRSDAEREFGSDSFLDIIANIVGILIILIVMAGVKVARQATMTEESAEVPAAVSEPADELNGDDSVTVPPEIRAAVDAQSEVFVSEAQVRELERQIAALTLELNESQGEVRESQTELVNLENDVHARRLDQQASDSESMQQISDVNQSIQLLQSSLDAVDTTGERYSAALTTLTRRQKYVNDALKQIAVETRQLSEVLDDAEARQPDAALINHRLSPVGRPVSSDELHFRLKSGKVAWIPLNDLLDRMRGQVLARRGAIMNFKRYEGLAGPIGGFNLQYVVQREATSRYLGPGQQSMGFRIAIARWTILPADTLEAESVEDAVRVGSRFRQILEATDPDSTITIWLYPEDFENFGQLRQLAHRLNLRVAARPLPEGTPIAGSPNGSRSTSQ